jgi:hypothetical protein
MLSPWIELQTFARAVLSECLKCEDMRSSPLRGGRVTWTLGVEMPAAHSDRAAEAISFGIPCLQIRRLERCTKSKSCPSDPQPGA